jgi:hypothetical protein
MYSMEYYSAIKEEKSEFCDNMNEFFELYAKWISQTEKDKYCMISRICGT